MKPRPATRADLADVVRLRRTRARWLAERGSDQWSDIGLDESGFRARVAASIDAGETWMLDGDHGRPIATIAVDQHTDPGLWTPEEIADAVVIHRMITDPHAAGTGIGSVLLDLADTIARERGKQWVRLDAWTSNTQLHQLYERHGFHHVRTPAGHSTPSAALFERKATPDNRNEPWR